MIENGSMTPFVSVIIPVYNDQSGIDTCLMALAQQTWPRDYYEVIVVDNASKPPIQLNSTAADFARIVVCPTPGAYAARNAGIGFAHGEILAFTDADCIPEQDWIRNGANALDAEKRGCVMGGEVIFMLSQNPTAIEQYQYLTGFMQQENIEHRGFTATANLFISQEKFVQIGSFDEKLLSGGDREWCWRASRLGFPIKYSPETIVRTFPRVSLAAAIRQTRRVAGGRYALSQLGLEHIKPTGIKPHRSVWDATKWILTHPDLSLWNRGKVFAVASVLKLVQVFEIFRLSLGVNPERR